MKLSVQFCVQNDFRKWKSSCEVNKKTFLKNVWRWHFYFYKMKKKKKIDSHVNCKQDHFILCWWQWNSVTSECLRFQNPPPPLPPPHAFASVAGSRFIYFIFNLLGANLYFCILRGSRIYIDSKHMKILWEQREKKKERKRTTHIELWTYLLIDENEIFGTKHFVYACRAVSDAQKLGER